MYFYKDSFKPPQKFFQNCFFLQYETMFDRCKTLYDVGLRAWTGVMDVKVAVAKRGFKKLINLAASWEA